MKIEQYDNIYFLGIGGIGMSALARWFMKKGLKVSGYDRTATALTAALEAEGMVVHYDDNVQSIPAEVRSQKDKTLVVFTPAIPKDHQEHAYLKEQGYTILKRSEVLGLITKGYKTIGVAGTHGKTTTSSLVSHILHVAGRNMVGFLGGITTNYSSNLIMQGEVTPDTTVVVEADEFDRSFLRLFPQIAIITSADADHLDIYGDHDALITSFRDYIKQINTGGALIIHESVAEQLTAGMDHVTKYVYSMSRGQFFAGNINASSGFFEFDLHGLGSVEHVRLGVPGFHNIENAIAASVAAHLCGVPTATIVEALGSFKGVKRRFEFIVRGKKVVYVDDYAHHPTEIEAFLRSMKSMYPGRKLTVIFQPHLFSRTRDFAEGFSASLSLADELLLMDIYPARELPIPGVDSDMLMKDITSPVKIRCNKNDLMEKLASLDLDVVVTVGAGDIDTFIEPIKKLVETKYEG
ncbi:UDP-N-acetylmuramate--L-alanine ligase [Parachryseolinea silvisoli]|uniref:UDP-N-acetylmuramate--L-alanine ligase n=1 Tax=Parachryseolinea silvisoli TaxID=2873601 RepID=UPI002265C31B|nr:UDP-N-acetylmuramate--L-alanine ligase [Parachryseolinea silvisoli]MCD9018496.1 UDP-N-acetylmuramate--L-alanine ligase [Parachryseolinea silvisoli]